MTTNAPKTVPEADFLALKQSLESKVEEMEAKLSASGKELVTAQSSLSSERAAHKAVEARLGELTPQVKKLTDDLTASNTELTKFRTASLESRRQALVTRGIDPEKAKTLDESALTVLEAHLPVKTTTLPGVQGKDVGGAGSGNGAAKSGIEADLEVIAAARKRNK